MEIEPRDEFEQDLRDALERRPAPPGLKRKIMERRNLVRERRSWFARAFSRGSRDQAAGRMGHPAGVWLKVAATVVLAATIGGGVEWRARQVEEQRKGEQARQQVMTALRITEHALNQVHARLAAHDRGGE